MLFEYPSHPFYLMGGKCVSCADMAAILIQAPLSGVVHFSVYISRAEDQTTDLVVSSGVITSPDIALDIYSFILIIDVCKGDMRGCYVHEMYNMMDMCISTFQDVNSRNRYHTPCFDIRV